MKKFLFLLIVLFSWNCQAQYEGFYSNKNEVNLSAGISFTSINPFQLLRYSNYASKYYKVKNNALAGGSNVVDLNYSFGYSHAIKKNFAIGFELNYEGGNVGIESISVGQYETQIFENFRTNTFSILPKLIFASKSSLLPIGLSHQIGIGISRTNVRSREYAYFIGDEYYDPFSTYPITGYNATPINYSLVAKSIKVMYELNVKTPISKTLTINYGIRYNVNIPNGFTIKSGPTQTTLISNNSLYEDIRAARIRKVASFNIGVSYLF